MLDMHGKEKIIRIAVLASGRGSNFEVLVKHFNRQQRIRVELLLCNKPGAGVLELAKQYSIPGLIKTNWESDNGEALLEELKSRRIDYLVLAGFLKKIPLRLIENFPRRIINIHPALLPRFGGKGMYGANVHRAVIESGEKESGITIHFVDEHYDTGDVIFQARCRVEDSDSAESLAEKIHLLEHKHFPDVVESVILSQNPG